MVASHIKRKGTWTNIQDFDKSVAVEPVVTPQEVIGHLQWNMPGI